MVSTTKRRRLEPGNMINGYNPPVPNGHLLMKIAAVISDASVTKKVDENEGRTELDSHANMCVLGRQCYIISHSGKSVNVGAFTESAGGLNEVPIVDAMLAYDCKRTNQVYLLVLRNVLYIESMTDNLIPPFILREAGIIVNKKAKIHCKPGTATEEDHTIQEKETGLFITMHLQSIFSYFPTRKPDEEDIEDGVVVFITPEGVTWEPYDESYADNEAALTNKKGEMLPPSYELKEFVTEEDYPNIDSVMVMNDAVNRHDRDAVIATFAVQDVDFDEEGIGINLRMSEVATAAVKPFSLD